MKATMIVILLTLVGCATQPPARVNDTRWSDYVHDTMIECGEVAAKIADGNE